MLFHYHILGILFISFSAVGADKPPVIDVVIKPDLPPESSGRNKPDTKDYDARVTSRCPEPFIYKADIEKDGEKAFVVGATNSRERIGALTSITGVSIAQLERRMQKNGSKRDWFEGANLGARNSMHGFLKQDQRLKDVMMSDARLAIQKGLTHKQMAEPLIKALEAMESPEVQDLKHPDTATFHFNGRKYQIKGTIDSCMLSDKPCSREHFWSGWVGGGVQGSPFNDKLFSAWIGTITDLQTGNELKIDSLTPHLICRYGFYQGGRWRIDPDNIVKFFRLTNTTPASKSTSAVK